MSLPFRFQDLTKSEYMGLIAKQGCYICKKEAEIHHNTKGRKAYGTKASDYDTIPLCPDHHRGEDGVHANIPEWEAKHGDQEDMAKKVMKKAILDFNNHVATQTLDFTEINIDYYLSKVRPYLLSK